jgi:hypothetical protein
MHASNLRRLLDPSLGICYILLLWERAYALNRRLAHDLLGDVVRSDTLCTGRPLLVGRCTLHSVR